MFYIIEFHGWGSRGSGASVVVPLIGLSIYFMPWSPAEPKIAADPLWSTTFSSGFLFPNVFHKPKNSSGELFWEWLKVFEFSWATCSAGRLHRGGPWRVNSLSFVSQPPAVFNLVLFIIENKMTFWWSKPLRSDFVFGSLNWDLYCTKKYQIIQMNILTPYCNTFKSKGSITHVKHSFRAALIEVSWKRYERVSDNPLCHGWRLNGPASQNKGMPATDSAQVDIIRRSSHTSPILSIWSVCSTAATRESGTLCCIMLQSCLGALWTLITQANVNRGYRDRQLS